MVNSRIGYLDELLKDIDVVGVRIDPKRKDYRFLRFARIWHPDGSRAELW